MQKTKVFLADDHAIMREGLKLLINKEPDMEVVGEAGDGQAAYDGAMQLRPDVVVMDISMPGKDGAWATGAIKSAYPEIKVLVLTVHEDQEFLNLLLKQGAAGYVLKSAIAEELTAAIRQIMQGRVYLDAKITQQLVHNIVHEDPHAPQTAISLSERETEVLRAIAWGYSNSEIADQLHLSVRTVETYKARMMEKLNFKSRTEIVRYALGRGWLSDPMG